MKRLINATTSEILSMNKDELLMSIKACEGRVILSENVVIHQGPVGNVTNAEIAKAFGADMILLNALDVLEPKIYGMKNTNYDVVNKLHTLVGKSIGVNLEPVDLNADLMENRIDISYGRQANEDTLKRIEELGFDFVCLTGNPATGVTNSQICDAIKLAKKHFGGIIIAGKMHSSGSDESVSDIKTVKKFIDCGADIILVPAVGTVPGFDSFDLKEIVKMVHKNNKLVLSAIGTSQESADTETIRSIAIENKICGVDIQHIGDAGFGGVALPENILTMSKAIRGMRHTVAIMARSINR